MNCQRRPVFHQRTPETHLSRTLKHGQQPPLILVSDQHLSDRRTLRTANASRAQTTKSKTRRRLPEDMPLTNRRVRA
ncbi:hypothetical protein SKAU_G00376410 [Synaphobranchus kaupii]|uniref:Uncharacterized protein n=1 Tax=Synaphobranchus kaupii TaxID=118154 RepID=A0A9Q1IE94_SYNKA|nr:hypothetical protein SKAU_G00376410 [Synaphobranchus kaupii]